MNVAVASSLLPNNISLLPSQLPPLPCPRHTTFPLWRISSNASASPASTLSPTYTVLQAKLQSFRRARPSVNVEEQTPFDVAASQSEDKPFGTFGVDAETLALNPRPSVTSLEDAEAHPANDSVAGFRPGRNGSAKIKSSSEVSYLKSITRGHWELITEFLNEEPDKERRQALREACTFLISTINNVRFILHNKYYNGEKLEAEDDEVIQKVLVHHPDFEEKVGCGVEFIKIDHHPVHGCRCFFVVQKDGSSVDFSFRKCILELGKQMVGLSITRKLLDFKQ